MDDPGVQNPGVVHPTAKGHDQDEMPADNVQQVTEQDRFEAAENEGRARAERQDDVRPRRTVKPNQDKDFIYVLINMLLGLHRVSEAEAQTLLDALTFVTAQMSTKAGLKYFGNRGAEAIVKELRQLIVLKVMTRCLPSDLTSKQKAKALKYLMFLKEKRCGKIKGRGCTDRQKQRIYKTKAETSSPTVSIESLTLSCLINAMENRDVGTCDIPAAFMQAEIDEEVHIKLEGELTDLLISVDESYSCCITFERGKKVIYALLNKALYGTVQASLLFWMKLSTFLVDKHGFVWNPYDYCVVNKVLNGSQCTIVWYVNDLKISHQSKTVVTQIMDLMKDEFGKDMDLTITRGKVHDYLGIRFQQKRQGSHVNV
jgi:Reverse transcriptase (RNA-dependent DNA polymerase)